MHDVPGMFVLTGGEDGSVFISDALPEKMAMPLPPVPETGASFDLDTPDEAMELDEVRKRPDQDLLKSP